MDIKNLDNATLEKELDRHRKAIEKITEEKARREQDRLDSAWEAVINSLKYYMDLSGNDIEIYDTEHTIRLGYGGFEGIDLGCIRVYD